MGNYSLHWNKHPRRINLAIYSAWVLNQPKLKHARMS